ncbi:hypothetical protein BGZ70_001812 [Mortierella alpina]|uniref:GAR domain-containing protein n=1 Tax=Mortierella alpina TaxID=64518 RepID=A0A9P6LXR7_MORAP|nr:hypothetical protein BGZ70_001812 [Mortierella alpina]
MSQPQDTTSSTPSLSMAQEPNDPRPEALYHSYHAQVQNLKQLPVPYSDLYRALASYETMELHPLSANFRKMAADLSVWLETAEKAVFSLEMDIQQDSASGRQDVSELDLIMSRFHPNIDMLRELKEKIKSRLQSTGNANSVAGSGTEEPQLVDQNSAQDAFITEQELEATTSAIQSSWSTLNSMMTRAKGVLASVRVRGDLLTQMEVVLAEVEEIGLEIDSFREELARQALDAGASRASQSISSPPYLLPSVTAESMVTSAEEIKAKQPDTEALTLLDSRIESLGTTIDALTVRIESLPLDAPRRDELREHYAQLLRLWDDGKARREKINVDMKERRWLGVFEQVAGQVESMMESVDRAVVHCKGLIDQIKVMVKDKVIPAAPIDREHLYTIFKSFEAKHKYYAPAINKMLNMLENGIESRMTRDPDVIGKHRSMKERWDHLRGGLDQVELDMGSIEKMLDILDASIPSYAPTPPAQLPEKPLFAMRRSQTQTGWQPSEQSTDAARSASSAIVNWTSDARRLTSEREVSANQYTGSPPAMVAFTLGQQSPKYAVPEYVQQLSIAHTTTSSPSIPGIPYAPSAAATYSRSPSSAGFHRDTSPSPAPSAGSSIALTRARSVSCTPSLSRSPSQQRPTFSPAGSLSKLSTGVQASRSVSPAPRATSPAPRSTSPAPAGSNDRKSSLRLPPPVATTDGSRLRQHSAPGLPSNVQRRSSSPGPGNNSAAAQAKLSTRPPFGSSFGTQGSRGSNHMGLRESHEEQGHSRPRRISFGSTLSNQTSSTFKSERSRPGQASGSTLNMATRVNGTSLADEPTSPSTSLTSSTGSFTRPRHTRPETAPSGQGSTKLSARVQEMSLQEPMVPYMPIRGDELDEEFGKVLNATPVPVQVRRVGDGKYYFGGRVEEQAHGGLSVAGGKMVLCRLMEYGRVNSGNDDDSGVSSGESQSSVEDDLQQQQQQQQQKTSQLQQPRWNALSKVVSVLRRPEPAHSRTSRPRARSVNNAPLATAGKSNRKVMVRVGGGWQELNVYLSDLAAKSSSLA